MAIRGMFIFAPAFLLMGFNLFASGFFTAINDGKNLRNSFAVPYAGIPDYPHAYLSGDI